MATPLSDLPFFTLDYKKKTRYKIVASYHCLAICFMFLKVIKNKPLANDFNILFLKQIVLRVYQALNTVQAEYNVSFVTVMRFQCPGLEQRLFSP